MATQEHLKAPSWFQRLVAEKLGSLWKSAEAFLPRRAPAPSASNGKEPSGPGVSVALKLAAMQRDFERAIRHLIVIGKILI